MKRQARKIWIDMTVILLIFALPLSAALFGGVDWLDSMGRGASALTSALALPEGGYEIWQQAVEDVLEPDDDPLPGIRDTAPDTQTEPPATTPETPETEAAPLPDPDDVAQAMALIPEANRGVIETSQFLSNGQGDNYFTYGNGSIRNATNYSNSEMLDAASGPLGFGIELNSAQPQVLIVHTHSTESYDRFDVGFYDIDYPTRSTDINQNINAVGQRITDRLNALGINTVHATEYHDYPSYNNAYSRSAVTTQKYLDMYPSIKIVLDIHRDGIQREDGTRVKPTITIGGQKAAQIMIVSGADDGTMDMPNFRENLKFAVRLQDSVAELYPGLARPVYLAYRHYNQNMTTGSLLIEVGAESNTLNEAIYTGELIANSLAYLFGAYSP